MILSKMQFNKLPDNYKQYFMETGGDSFDGCSMRKNIHP